MSVKPILIHGHAGGPNPWKVALLASELNIPYDMQCMEFPKMKEPDFLKKNPNGRSPVIEDPNTGLTLWESGAIIEYLIENYDKEGKFTYKSTPEKYYLQQWLHFQVSGQGPYYGQRAWFTLYHPEQIDSVKERYGNEIKRVMGVIDLQLKQTGQKYLVGDKFTYADLSFIPWNWLVPYIMGDKFEGEIEKEYPNYWDWWTRVNGREASKKVSAERGQAMKKGH